MNIYLDEDMVNGQLTRLLEKAGHDLETPVSAGYLGRSDPFQLTIAIPRNRVILTANYRDFEELHDLIVAARGHHPGILVVRQDNDPTRDLTPKGIVAAIWKLESSSLSIANEYTVLNHWR